MSIPCGLAGANYFRFLQQEHGALGIRIPAGAAHTYTTLPALAK